MHTFPICPPLVMFIDVQPSLLRTLKQISIIVRNVGSKNSEKHM